MKQFLSLAFKGYRKIIDRILAGLEGTISFLILYLNNSDFKNFVTKGIPYIEVARTGSLKIGANFKMNNGLRGNPIGRPQRCTFVVGKEGKLIIGDNVGMSSTALVAHKEIVIGDNVKLGGGVCIYDTDFHSLKFSVRRNFNEDVAAKKSVRVIIGNDVFIGAHSTILKGVSIGDRSVVGSNSVVTKEIPSDEIWAGNPARFIRKL